MNIIQNEQEKIYDELIKLYNASKSVGSELFTFWLLTRKSGGDYYRFNRGGKVLPKVTGYTDIGIVDVGSASRLQLVGFHTNNNSFKSFKFVVRNRQTGKLGQDDVLCLINRGKQKGVTVTMSNGQSFLNHIETLFSGKIYPSIGSSSLMNWIEQTYIDFFNEVKKYDSTNSTKFYEILKISDADFNNNRNINDTNMAPIKGTLPPVGTGMSITTSAVKSNIAIPLNQILYGPPGTGKTYHTVEKALKILNPSYCSNILNDTSLDDDDKFDKLKVEFDKLKQQGRIVFTTFHQSLSYEDFIEGIKPETNTRINQLEYPVKPGIFKSLCDKIQDDKVAYIRSVKYNPNKNTKGTIGVRGSEETRERMPRKELESAGKFEKDFYEKYKYVLIIDEINRGNVSQIFGELITLLEEDKRLGDKFELKARLPYSNKDFGVPSNLYIIGTMNTADRSVEALDTALRRRFSFVEMMPNSSLLNTVTIQGLSVGLEDLLNVINQRIVLLKDREHQIGHSYFMKCKDLADLKAVFKDNIAPLLQEYFYGNYYNIGLVLGEEFVKKENPVGKFGKGFDYEGDAEPGWRMLTDDEWDRLDMNVAISALMN